MVYTRMEHGEEIEAVFLPNRVSGEKNFMIKISRISMPEAEVSPFHNIIQLPA